tara:strand:- start:55 stop:621 length:567 start_codon:yes stop_codon:yes gene_type:complete
MVKTQAARAAGSALQKYFATLLGTTGRAGREATSQVLKTATNTFAPGVTQKALNPFLRAGAQNITPQLGGVAAQTFVVGAGLSGTTSAIDKMFDQQSQYSQPIKKGTTGDRGMDDFLLRQQLQNQKFQLDMQLVQAKANAVVPKNQPNSAESMLRLAEAEKIMTEAGELTNKEVQGIARSIYGTGTRL